MSKLQAQYRWRPVSSDLYLILYAHSIPLNFMIPPCDSHEYHSCEMCKAGYHGNATIGSPNDCLVCPCPLPVISNNFAESCAMVKVGPYQEDVRCNCKEGYVGFYCEKCGPGL